MDPAPLVTFTIRGVFADLSSSGTNVSTMKVGPVAFVWKAAFMPWNNDVSANSLPVIAALLTRASRRPYFSSTVFTAAMIEDSLLTSICSNTTSPGSLRAFRSLMAASPFSIERLPRRIKYLMSLRSWDTSSKPIPPFAA
jgi:hypothetical protein